MQTDITKMSECQKLITDSETKCHVVTGWKLKCD